MFDASIELKYLFWKKVFKNVTLDLHFCSKEFAPQDFGNENKRMN